jgi:hypothetical protein
VLACRVVADGEYRRKPEFVFVVNIAGEPLIIVLLAVVLLVAMAVSVEVLVELLVLDMVLLLLLLLLAYCAHAPESASNIDLAYEAAHEVLVQDWQKDTKEPQWQLP